MKISPPFGWPRLVQFASGFLLALCGILPAHGQLAPAAGKMPAPGQIPVAEYAKRTVVLCNSALPDSVTLAKFYAEKRGIPVGNILALEMPKEETISRAGFNSTILEPIKAQFTAKNWWSVQETPQGRLSTRAEMRVIAIMHGVPLRINSEPKREKNPDTGKIEVIPHTPQTENAASVDGELAMLGVLDAKTDGPLNNLFFKKDALFLAQALAPIYLIGRIDGPSLADCKRLITDAIATEKTGLFGRAYIDLALKTEGGYKQGEDWLKAAATLWSDAGFPTVVDLNAATLPTNYPMPDAAIYLGWYTLPADGPFLNPGFKFLPGAIACHIHSFSATSVRNAGEGYVATFVQKGAAAVPGNVFEPYLGLTVHLDIWSDRLRKGYTLAEATCMATPAHSWMAVMIGDPLYRPFISGSTPIPAATPYPTIQRLLMMHAAGKTADRKPLIAQLQEVAEKSNAPVAWEALALYSMGVLEDSDPRINQWFDKAALVSRTNPVEHLHQRFTQISYLRHTGQEKKAAELLQSTRKAHATAPELKAFDSFSAAAPK